MATLEKNIVIYWKKWDVKALGNMKGVLGIPNIPNLMCAM
jgi:hypothetical protein